MSLLTHALTGVFEKMDENREDLASEWRAMDHQAAARSLTKP